MAKRDEDRRRKKKERRQKRLQKRRLSSSAPFADEDIRELADSGAHLESLLGALEAHDVSTPATWPGASDASVARPDLVKFDLATAEINTQPGATKLQQLQDGLGNGLLGFLPELDHFAMEEILWHGLPGDPWHPIDTYLEHKGDAFPPAAREQLHLWKEARIGFYEVGEVRDDTVGPGPIPAPVAGAASGTPGWANGCSSRAVVNTPNGPTLLQTTELTPTTPEQARQFGIYFAVPTEREEMIVAGGMTLMPVDVTSVNMAALAEYHAYRELAGPPPGTRGQGPYFRVR